MVSSSALTVLSNMHRILTGSFTRMMDTHENHNSSPIFDCVKWFNDSNYLRESWKMAKGYINSYVSVTQAQTTVIHRSFSQRAVSPVSYLRIIISSKTVQSIQPFTIQYSRDVPIKSSYHISENHMIPQSTITNQYLLDLPLTESYKFQFLNQKNLNNCEKTTYIPTIPQN